MNWFKKHPEHLASEVKELETNSNYHAEYTCRDNLLVSCGEVIVRSKETNRYPVLILYPESTPYSLPRVFLLNRLLTKDEVGKISTLNLLKASEYLRDKIKFFNVRHQGSDGSLCLLETDNMYLEGAQLYSVRQVIGRVRDWFAGLNNGRLPPDSQEVELYSHFRNKDGSVEFLLPEFIFDDNLSEGIIYAAQTPTSQLVYRNYICVAMFAKNRVGIIEPPRVYDREQHLLYAKIPKPSEIIKYEIEGNTQQGIPSKLECGELVKVYWFDITSEPEPFEKVDELLSYIGNGDRTTGQKKLIEWMGNEVWKLDRIYVGLKFPGRRGGKEWQLFVLKKGKEFTYLFNSSFEMKVEMLSNYHVSAVHSETFTDQSYHIRNSTRASRDILKNKKITIIGCGALGSEIADILVKAGIGQIRLIDKEIFRAHNAVRHLVSTERTGIPKVLAVAERLILHNPFVDVNLENSIVDILTDNINSYFLEGSIAISTIADDNVEAYLNEQAVIYDRLVIYARALRGGKAARIFRVTPGKDACKNCLALYSLEKDPLFTGITEDETLPTITNECNNPVRPASAADLKMIASITSRIIIDYLHHGEEDKNQWIWTTERLEGIKFDDQMPFALHSSFLPPHPNCKYCKKEDPIEVSISGRALNFMRSEISKEPGLETGGILVGYREPTGKAFIELASEPGPKAIKEKGRFVRDTEYCQKVVNENYQKCGDRGLYIGEWHYHPYPENRPSNVDLLSLTSISEQKEYVLDKPVMIILSNKGELSCTVHPFNKRYYFVSVMIRE